jgi:threonine dehydrogenase-like Zn-dependent dehydrogenase
MGGLLWLRKRRSGANNNLQLYPQQQTPLLTTGHCVRCGRGRRAQCCRPLPAGDSAYELAEIIGLQESLRAPRLSNAGVATVASHLLSLLMLVLRPPLPIGRPAAERV